MFCKYKDILGVPGQGVHSIRFMNIAVVDVAMTILGAYLIAFYFNLPFWVVLVFLFSLGIILHRLFCVKTTIDKLV